MYIYVHILSNYACMSMVVELLYPNFWVSFYDTQAEPLADTASISGGSQGFIQLEAFGGRLGYPVLRGLLFLLSHGS